MLTPELTQQEKEEMREHAEDWVRPGPHHGRKAARNVLRLLDVVEDLENQLARANRLKEWLDHG